MNFVNWLWPQWTVMIMNLLSLVMNISMHDKPRDNYNGPLAFLSFVLSMWILWCGGFWK